MIISFTSLVCDSNLRQAVVMGFKSLSLKLLDIFRNSLGGAEAAALFSHNVHALTQKCYLPITSFKFKRKTSA